MAANIEEMRIRLRSRPVVGLQMVHFGSIGAEELAIVCAICRDSAACVGHTSRYCIDRSWRLG